MVSVRSRACSRGMYPRSTPMGYAVSANPMAAMLAGAGAGWRSGIMPFTGSDTSQKKRKVRSWMSSNRGSSAR